MNYHPPTGRLSDNLIAIVGMACRFPGAPDPRALWRLLLAGDHALREVPEDRWPGSAYVDEDRRAPAKMVTARGGFLDRVDGFDAAFFGISAREAAQVDPQQRLALELSWEALEHAGVAPDRLRGSDTAVFMGAMWTDYARLHGIADIEQHSGTGWHLGVVPGRVSYALGLRGPSMAVNTACSSSLVAVHLACKALLDGETSLALAGGVSLMLAPHVGVAMSKFGGTSASGRCFAYDARADGYVRGEGGGVVALRRYADARARGERVVALIRATGVNNDGGSEGLTVPSEAAQRSLLREVYARAGVDPKSVFYVEGHGTGTPVGDPIEARALGSTLAGGRERALWLGSIKPNIGHTEAASGVASLIKTALALEAGFVPPNHNFAEPNPAIDFEALELRVPTTAQVWQGPRLAGVNSFGFGGTNCHVVLAGAPSSTEATASAQPDAPSKPRAHRLVTVSARDAASLDARVAQLRDAVEQARTQPEAKRESALDDLAHTLWHRRAHLEHRAFVCASSLDELAARLDHDELEHRVHAGQRARKLVFVFSGQGSQWPAMGRELIDLVPAFRARLSECSAVMEPMTGWSLIDAVEGGTLARHLEHVDGIQPAIFAIQVALAATWRALGFTPAAVVGHSMGEVSAAVAAGAISLVDGAKITCERARLLRRISGLGGMLSINLPTAEIEAVLGSRSSRYAGLGIAVDLGLGSTIVSGGHEGLAALRVDIERSRPEVEVRDVAVDVAAHSPQIDALADEFLASIAEVSARPSAIQMISSVTGDAVDHHALTPAYWVRNLRQRVRFGEAAARLFEAGHSTFIELSPHPLLRWPLGQMSAARGRTDPCVLGSMRRARPEHEQLLTAIGELHLRGFEIALDQAGALVELPAYPWQRRRFWPAQARDPSRARRPLRGGPELVARFDPRRIPALVDHRVDGQAHVSAGLALELFARAWSMVEPDAGLVVEALEFHAPLPGERGVRLELREGSVELESADEARARDEHTPARVEARLARLDPALELPRPRPVQLTRELDAPAHYAQLEARGIGYGSGLRAVESVALGPGAARVSLGAGSPRAALFDAAFQAVSAALGDSSPVLVAGVAAVRVSLDALSRATTVHASVTALSEHERSADAWLLDDQGCALAHFAGIRLVARAQVQASGPLRRRIWRPLDLLVRSTRTPTRQLAMLPAEASALARCRRLLAQVDAAAGGVLDIVERDLDARGCDTIVVPCPTPSANEAPADWVRRACGRVIAATRQALAVDGGRPPRLVVISERGALVEGDEALQTRPGATALAAVLRVALAEHPQLRTCAVDLGSFDDPSEAEILARVLASPDLPPELAIRGRSCLTPALAESPLPGHRWAPRAGSIVVTGALGGIGRAVVEHLAELGAERLLLVGRRALDDETRRYLDRLHARTGAALDYRSVDIGDPQALERVLGPELDGLIGVIHAAADLASAALVDHDDEALDAALRPKFAGAWHLHELTRERALDFFVLFGSLGGWVGLPGQAGYAAANAALDGLARYRRGLGLPATTIGWCGWRGLGFASRSGGAASLQRLANEGIGALEPSEALDLCERLLGAGTSVPASVAIMPRPTEEADEVLTRETTRAALSSLPAVRRRAAVHDAILDQVGAVLREDPSRVDPKRPLRDLGLDSLMSVELAERLTRALGIPASNTLIWRYPSVEALVGHALAELGGARVPEPSTVDPDANAELEALVDELGELSDEEVEALTRVL